MISQLTVEQANECGGMYEQIMGLRNELSRVMELMQGFVAREKALHEMVDALQSSMSGAMAGMRDIQMPDGSMRHPDPVVDTQEELKRINGILRSPAVPPPEVPPHLQQLARGPAPRSAAAPP